MFARVQPPAVVRQCRTDQLTVSIGPVPGGLSHEGLALEFRNRSSATCTLRGYPGAAGLSASGATVFNAPRSLSGYLGGARRVATVTLRPGASASAMLEWLVIGRDDTSAGCPHPRSLQVTPPNDRTSVRLPAAVGPVCSVQLHPVVAGRGAGAG